MADVKISELSEATSLADSDVLAGVNSGTTRKFTLARLKAFFLTGLSKNDVGLSNVANERQYSSNNPQPADKTTISTATATTMSGILQGTGSAVTALPFDSSTIANDATHVPSSAAVKSALDALIKHKEIGITGINSSNFVIYNFAATKGITTNIIALMPEATASLGANNPFTIVYNPISDECMVRLTTSVSNGVINVIAWYI